jgi:hypothetical protein
MTSLGNSLSNSPPHTGLVTPPLPLPEGWVDHPKIPFTMRMVWIGVAIFLIAIVVAGSSIYFRRTQLELTRKFWGEDAVTAMQLAPYVFLQFDSDADKKPVDLTGTPGLGHLRHALLEQRHYLWETETAESIDSLTTTNAKFATLVFSDPRTDETVKVPTARIRLELEGGWVGTIDGARRVQLIERAQPAVRHFLTLLRNTQQSRYGDRDDSER